MKSLALTISLLILPCGLSAQEGKDDMSAEQREAITQSVDLYDSLVSCMTAGDFEAYGFSPMGPCGDWMQDFRTVRDSQNGLAILQAGHDCIAAEAYNYGGTFHRNESDLEWRESLRESFEACRDALE